MELTDSLSPDPVTHVVPGLGRKTEKISLIHNEKFPIQVLQNLRI